VGVERDAPVLAVLPDVEFNEDTRDSLKVFAYISDVDNDTTNFEIQVEVLTHQAGKLLPGDLRIQVDNITGFVKFIPGANVNGLFTVEVRINDGEDFSNRDTMNVNVNPVNDPPVMTAIADTSIYYDENFHYQVIVNDIDCDVFTWSDNTDLFDIDQSGRINFTPDADLRGTYAITISASDGQYTVSQEFSLRIYGDAEAPLAEVEISEDDSTMNHGLKIYVTANDTLNGLLGSLPENLITATLLAIALMSRLPGWLRKVKIKYNSIRFRQALTI